MHRHVEAAGAIVVPDDPIEETDMQRIFPTSLAFAALIAAPAFATEPVPGAVVGANEAEVRSALAEDGYTLTRYKLEHGRIEAYALKDGRRWELKIDPQTGRILGVERDD